MSGSTCKLCLAAGVDPKKAHFTESDDFYNHLEMAHAKPAAAESGEGETTPLLDKNETTAGAVAPHRQPRHKK